MPRDQPLETGARCCKVGESGWQSSQRFDPLPTRVQEVLMGDPQPRDRETIGAGGSEPVAAVRFLAEAEAVAKLQHSHIVQIHHIGEADGLPFFELEYVEGGSLDKRLDGTPWPAQRATRLIEALARGVAEAHRLGIIHR